MKNSSLHRLDNIVVQKSRELGFNPIKRENSGSVVSILRDDWHLAIELSSPIVPTMPFQMSIRTEGLKIRMLLFPSPPIIKKSNVGEFIHLANAANCYLYRGTALGRFWVDEANLDFAYELNLKEEMLEHCEAEVAEQLFDIPWSHYKALHTPLAMLAGDIWKADLAVRFLTELMEEGHVHNEDFGLW